MIAPSVMNLTALPALADNSIRMIDGGAHAIVVDRSEPRSAEKRSKRGASNRGDSNEAA